MDINTLNLKEKFSGYLKLKQSYIKEKKTQLLSFAFLSDELPVTSVINFLQNQEQNFFYWNLPEEKEEFLGFFPIYNINEYGINRIEKTGEKIVELQNSFISNWNDINLSNVPLVMGGIKFAPDQKSKVWNMFSDSDWFIPGIALLKRNEKFYVVFNFLVTDKDTAKLLSEFNEKIKNLKNINLNKNGSAKFAKIKSKHTKPVAEWYSIINSALKKIYKGELKKTVLSREVKLELNDIPPLSSLLTKLSGNYPGCYVFAFAKNNSIFIGASPEKLVKISNKVLEIDALAGSVARGKNETEDKELEEFLLNSEKNINEQKAVVVFIKNLLGKISAEITFDDKVKIRKLPNIQHLWTPITAKLQNGYMLFDVLKTLHPTPAICGTPWDVARDNILELEEHDRGLYSGNIGWFNFNGDGEFAVGIRSALLKGNEVYAYAGCGIVKGSEPQSEFDESEIKLKPILSLFVDEKVYQP